MTEAEKITYIQALLNNDSEATNALVTIYLDLAKNAILNRLYPFGIPTDVTAVPTRYETLQCEYVRNQFLKRGAEGETVHNENGVNRTYKSEDYLLETITPFAKV